MLVFVEIVILFKFNFLFQGKERPGVDKTPCSVSHFWIFDKFNSLTPSSVSLREI